MTFTMLLRLTLFALAVSLIEVCILVAIAVIFWAVFKILNRTGKPARHPSGQRCPCCQKAEPPGPGSWRHPGTGGAPAPGVLINPGTDAKRGWHLRHIEPQTPKPPPPSQGEHAERPNPSKS